jgi:Mrp family chromosome partitioning ATPase/uncharacterized protein involved in exopolysaccharide biosynthesis
MKQKVTLKDDDVYNFMEVDQRFKNVIETFKSPVVVGMLSYELMLHDITEKRPFRVLDAKQVEKESFTKPFLDSVRILLQQKLARQELLVAYEPSDRRAYQLIQAYQYNNDAILKKLSVDRIQGTDYLNILFKSENPELSAFVVNTIGQKFYNFFTKINSERTGASIVKLDSLTNAKKNEYDMAVNALLRFREQVGSPNVGDRAKGAMEMLKTLTEQQNNNEAKLNELRGQLSSIKSQLADFSGSNSATPSSSNAEITSLLQTNRELARQLASKGGNDAAIQNQIDANVRRIQQLEPNNKGTSKGDLARKKDELSRRKTDIEYEISSLQGTISSVQQKINLYSGMSNQGGGDEVTLQRLQNEVDRINSEYQVLLSRSQSVQDVNVAPDINFKQTLIGQPAIKPEPGNRKLIVIMSTLGAFLLATFLILTRQLLDRSIKSPSNFSRQVKTQLLSSINKIAHPTETLRNAMKLQQSEAEAGTEIHAFKENIRKLRFEIDKSGKKVILVTSTQARQGKTTLLHALANSLSMANKKVLLVDANFSNNELSRIFEARPGLEQFSWSENESASFEKLGKIAQETGIPNCRIIGCEESVLSPLEILKKGHLFEHVALLPKQYDYVFVEVADLNTHADAKELSTFVEGILVVYSAKASLTYLDKESLHFLKTQSNKTIGAVLNEVQLENMKF